MLEKNKIEEKFSLLVTIVEELKRNSYIYTDESGHKHRGFYKFYKRK